MLLPIVLMLAAMYFLLYAPQRKKQKEHQALVDRLQQGDEVMTNAGIYGTVTAVKKDRVTVRVADGVKMEFARMAVQQNVTEEKRKGAADDTKASKKAERMPKGGEEAEALEVESTEVAGKK
ncbi:MAG: preprotein translocase subunit YajC [Opitutales bacterium]